MFSHLNAFAHRTRLLCQIALLEGITIVGKCISAHHHCEFLGNTNDVGMDNEQRSHSLLSLSAVVPVKVRTIHSYLEDTTLPRLLLDVSEHPGQLFSSHFIDPSGHLTPSKNQTGEDLIEKYGAKVSFLSGLKQGSEFIWTLIFGFLLVKYVFNEAEKFKS